MCGICGVQGSQDKELIKRMARIMSHRGPDQDGFYSDKDISLGHRRLSIVDLSERGKQPLSNEDRLIHLICNGEIYNYPELRKALEGKGHRFYSNSDNEVILHTYEEYGENFIERLRGMFAFALWDSKEKKLILARDRIGIKPLYYIKDGGKFFFASEIKSILEDRSIRREIDYHSYYSYLAFQTTLGTDTMFKNIKKLTPGHILIYQNKKITLRKYWDLTPQISDIRCQMPEENYSKKVYELLRESVRMRLMSDVPLGVLLSGGLDSSSIVGLMSQMMDQPVKTFSVGFGQPDDELEYARIIAKHFKTNHHEFIVKPKDLIKVLEKIVWHMDEPLADGGAIATYLVAEQVREHVKVILVGEGGDELFGGYSWHNLATPFFKFIPEAIKLRLYFYLTTFYRKKKAQNKDMYQEFKDSFYEIDKKKDLLLRLTSFEIQRLLPNSILMKVDKMTMAHSLEARVPFLDHELVEYSTLIPSKYKIRKFTGKYILRQTMKGLLPEEIIKRPKHGFLVPLGSWLRNELKEYAQELLLSSQSHARKFFSEKEIKDLFIKRNRLKDIENTTLLWRLLIFEIWHNTYIR